MNRPRAVLPLLLVASTLVFPVQGLNYIRNFCLCQLDKHLFEVREALTQGSDPPPVPTTKPPPPPTTTAPTESITGAENGDVDASTEANTNGSANTGDSAGAPTNTNTGGSANTESNTNGSSGTATDTNTAGSANTESNATGSSDTATDTNTAGSANTESNTIGSSDTATDTNTAGSANTESNTIVSSDTATDTNTAGSANTESNTIGSSDTATNTHTDSSTNTANSPTTEDSATTKASGETTIEGSSAAASTTPSSDSTSDDGPGKSEFASSSDEKTKTTKAKTEETSTTEITATTTMETTTPGDVRVKRESVSSSGGAEDPKQLPPITGKKRPYDLGFVGPKGAVIYDQKADCDVCLVDDVGIIYDDDFVPSNCSCSPGSIVDVKVCLRNIDYETSFKNVKSEESREHISRLLKKIESGLRKKMTSDLVRIVASSTGDSSGSLQLGFMVTTNTRIYMADLYVKNYVFLSLEERMTIDGLQYETYLQSEHCFSSLDVTPPEPEPPSTLGVLRWVFLAAAFVIVAGIFAITCFGKRDSFYVRFW